MCHCCLAFIILGNSRSGVRTRTEILSTLGHSRTTRVVNRNHVEHEQKLAQSQPFSSFLAPEVRVEDNLIGCLKFISLGKKDDHCS